MSIEAITLVIRGSQHSAGTLLALHGIANCANDAGIAWPSYEYLADYARCDKRTAIRHVNRLLKSGEISIFQKGGGRKSNTYALNIPQLSKQAKERAKMRGDNVSPLKKSSGDISDTAAVTPGVTAAVAPVSPEPSLNRHITFTPKPPSGGQPNRTGKSGGHRRAGERVLVALLDVARNLSPSDPARWRELTNAAPLDVRDVADRMGGWSSITTMSRTELRTAFNRAWRQRGSPAKAVPA